MELPFSTTPSKPGKSRFVIFWLGLIILCLCVFMGTVALAGWGFYTIRQKVQGKNEVQKATATQAAQWPIIFKEDFEKVSSKWYTGEDDNPNYHDLRSIINGVFRWTLENAEDLVFWETADAGNFRSVALSVDVRHTAGNAYDNFGLIFHSVAGNYYLFTIQDGGYYSVHARSTEQWNPIITNARTNAIRPGEVNHLLVIAENGYFKLFINGEFVNEFHDTTLAGGDVGIVFIQQKDSLPSRQKPQGVNLRTDDFKSVVEFDNFEVRAPEGVSAEQKQANLLPQIEPEPGRLVFATNREGNFDIFSMLTNGSDLKQLTSDPASDRSPRWSPDGEKIVFSSSRDGNSEIYSMDADGKHLTRLTSNPAEDIDPAWSPDGSHIIFASARDGNYNLYVMSPEGETKYLKRLTDTLYDEFNPVISPDRNQIMLQIKTQTVFDLAIMRPDGKKKDFISDGLEEKLSSVDGVWSPDGTQFAYAVIDEAGLGDIMVGETTKFGGEYPIYIITQEHGRNRYPAWSPSSKQIAFVSSDDGQADIYIILASGDGIYRVTHNEAIEESPDWTSP